MEIHEYPRPANDTGIGIHWTTGYATAIGMRQIRDFWIPEMKALGIKWVKIYNHDGALDFAELLLAENIMPIVRIYRPTPNPSRLDVKDVVQIDAFLRSGIRYFEFNSEPDRDAEWKGGRMPANGLNLVVENTIANLEIILERGGMPAIPAVANGSRWDIVGKIVAFGRKDLFAGPVWQAIHNYSHNLPPDYPYDIGNQEGAAYTYRFYQVVNEEEWSENSWRGRSLGEVNRLRSDRSNPGATVMDDHGCWLAYEYFDALNQKHLGHSLPLLSTECGYLVGEDRDPRYPATSPDLHMAQTLECCRIMMGTSQRFPVAPDYYFCTAFWLLGNAQLGSTSSWWESHAWYSDRWPGGALPLTFALKSEPKVARQWHGAVANELVCLYGTVANAGDCRTVVLYAATDGPPSNSGESAANPNPTDHASFARSHSEDDKEIDSAPLSAAAEEKAIATLDANNRYRFDGLAPGQYRLIVPGASMEQRIELTAGQQEFLLDLDLALPKRMVGRKSRIEGTVRGGAGAMLVLVQLDAGEEWTTMARDDGLFRFVDLPAGDYSLRVEPAGSRIERLHLDGLNEQQVELAVAGWGYTIRPLSPKLQEHAKLNALYCIVNGWPGLPVRVHADDWSSEPVYTGTAPEIGEFGCQLTGLESGYYIVSVDGVPDNNGRYTQLEARVQVDKKRTPLLEFVYTEMLSTSSTEHSQIQGRVIGGGISSTATKAHHTVILIDSMGNRQEQPVAPNNTFLFPNLAAGLYTVALLGYESTATVADLALDGLNQLAVELRLPDISGATDESIADQIAAEQTVMTSVIIGYAPNAAGRLARLVDTVGNEFQQYVNVEHRFRFANLAAGTYSLTIESGYHQSTLVVDGHNGLQIDFAELLPVWQAEISQAGSMPGYSLVRVEVEGMADLPVHIWSEDWEGMVRQTGSKAEYGPYTLEFSPLGPGHYMVEPTGLGLWTEVELSGLEAIWIHFRKHTQPLGDNRVVPLASTAVATADTATSDAPAIEPDRIEPDRIESIYGEESIRPGRQPVPTPVDSAASPTNVSQTDRSPAADYSPVVDSLFTGKENVPKKANHYLFVWAPPQDPNELSALLSYVTAEQPQIGRDRWLAFDADRVTIVGAEAIPDDDNHTEASHTEASHTEASRAEISKRSEISVGLSEFVQALEAAGVQVDYLSTIIGSSSSTIEKKPGDKLHG